MNSVHFIFYVANQERSTTFYSQVLGIDPHLNTPGMTQFALPGGATLGLMREAGIVELLGSALPDPRKAQGVPRSELYLIVDDAQAFLDRALGANARELSPLQERDWGDRAAYVLDPDGHVVAFAESVNVV